MCYKYADMRYMHAKADEEDQQVLAMVGNSQIRDKIMVVLPDKRLFLISREAAELRKILKYLRAAEQKRSGAR